MLKVSVDFLFDLFSMMRGGGSDKFNRLFIYDADRLEFGVSVKFLLDLIIHGAGKRG